MLQSYTRHRDMASRVIQRFGRAADLIREGEPTGDPWDPEPGEPVLLPVRIVETGYTVGQHDGTLIEAGDVVGHMAAPDGVTPRLTDGLEIDGEQFSLIDLKPIRPGSVVLAWEFHARR